MLVKDVMSKEVITVDENENLIELIAKFRKYNFHILPVIDENKNVLGIVEYPDIMEVFLPHNPLLEKLLKSTHLHIVEEEDILEAVLSVSLSVTVATLICVTAGIYCLAHQPFHIALMFGAISILQLPLQQR